MSSAIGLLLPVRLLLGDACERRELGEENPVFCPFFFFVFMFRAALPLSRVPTKVVFLLLGAAA